MVDHTIINSCKCLIINGVYKDEASENITYFGDIQ